MLNLKGQNTISLDETRAFVTTVCNAMVHDDSGELSTASTDNAGYYPYNYRPTLYIHGNGRIGNVL